ncbi:hypothetical protein AgCh_033622 [Apium graveolens]
MQFSSDETHGSIGRCIFFGIQGNIVWKDFNIVEKAGGIGNGITLAKDVTVNSCNLEIHLYWSGKGTTAVPDRDYVIKRGQSGDYQFQLLLALCLIRLDEIFEEENKWNWGTNDKAECDALQCGRLRKEPIWMNDYVSGEGLSEEDDENHTRGFGDAATCTLYIKGSNNL